MYIGYNNIKIYNTFYYKNVWFTDYCNLHVY